MKNIEQINFLKSQIDESIRFVNGNRTNNKRKAFAVQIGSILLSATASIVLGIKSENFEEISRIIALIFSTIVAVMAGIEAFYNHKKLWINYTETFHDLFTLRFDVEFRLKGEDEITEEEILKFRERYITILDENNDKWLKMRTENNINKK